MKECMKKGWLSPGGLLYAGGLSLAMGVACIWRNLADGYPDFSVQLSLLCVYLVVALPLWTMGAFGTDAAREDVPGTFFRFLVWHVIACALLSFHIVAVAPGVQAFVALLGFFVAGGVALSVCLVIARILRRPVASLAVSLVVMVVLRELPEIAASLTYAFGGDMVPVARHLIALSPFSLMTRFLSGIIDLRAVLSGAIAVMLMVTLSRGEWKKRITNALVLALFFALAQAQPAGIALVDVTPTRLTVASDQMADTLTRMNEPVTVYQVCEVGLEDVWIATYLEKLAERHAYIDYRPIDPSEDAEIGQLLLEDNSLIVRHEDTYVIAHADDLYAETYLSIGTRHSFEIEGVLLTALADASGIDLLEGGLPLGRVIDVDRLSIEPSRAQMLAWSFVVEPLILMLVGFILLWRQH